MKLKKYSALFLAVALLMSLITVSVHGADEGYSKRILVNVAQNKPVSSNQTEAPSYPFANLVDGRNTSFIIPADGANSAATEIVVDLQRKYEIEKIELYSRFDGAVDHLGRQYFQIMGANCEDFSDGVVLDYMEERNDEIFPSSGCFTSVQSGKNAYRYIKLKRTGGGYYGYSEFMVYAYQTVTEVSRGKTVTTNSGSALSGERAVNGTNSGESDAWVNDNTSEYNYLSVDLGKSLPIGMIEMEGRNITSENPATRQNIKVYGSNSINSLPELSSAASLEKEDGYDTLTYVGAMGGMYLNDEFPYAKYPSFYRTVCDESASYQFITFRNTTLHCSAYGEVRAYVVNPEVLSVTWDDDYLYINFSDEMSEKKAGNITLSRKSDGESFYLETAYEDSYTYRADISDLAKDEAYEITVSKDFVNLKGVEMAEDFKMTALSLNPLAVANLTIHSGSDGSGDAIDNLMGLSEVSAKATVSNNGKDDEQVSVFIVLYDENGRLKKISMKKEELEVGVSSDITAALEISGELTEGMYLKTYVWSMTKDKLMPLAESNVLFYDINNIYVSPTGDDDNSGTKSAPFKTIERAQEEVRSRNGDMTADINVNISGGTYVLESTLKLNEADSGTNGCYINYKAVDGEEVVLSGGRKIEGWELSDSESNIYKASVTGVSEIRNMYINGVSARAARSEGRIKPIELYYENDEPKGYYVSSDDVGIYENPSDIRLFYTQVWKYTLCNVEEIIPSETEGQNIIKMQDTAFAAAADTSTYLPLTKENAFYVENAKELLDKPGEFYFDKTENAVYYMAAADEDMSKAEAYIPVLDRLLEIEGSDLGSKAENIRFSGIHFAHAGRNDVENGYLGGQAQSVTPLVNHDTSYPLDTTIVGGNIRISRAENIEFTNNTFSGLSAVALGIYEGSNDIIVRGNTFYDIGDSAVTVGLPSDAYMEEAYYDEENNYLGRNVALYKPAKDANGGSIAEKANDGDAKTVWTTNYISNYWQVDLGEEYTISQIRIKSRLNYASNPNAYEQYELYRRNFKVLGSKYEDFSDGGVVLGEQTSTAFDFSNGFISDVETTEKFRYVRVVKTANEHFPLADIEVISPDQTVPLKEVSKRTVIDNNYITRVGEFNLGAPGIQLYYTEEAEVSHNTIKDVPYSGICVGWGWLNTTDSTTAKNNKIINNHIENYAMRTYDAGGVYLLGTQYGNLVEGNYMRNQPNAYYAFYADSGSVGFTVKNNVFSQVDLSFAIGTSYSASDKTDMTITDNWATTPCCTINFTDENSVVEEPTMYLESDVPSQVKTIIDNAGVSEEYKDNISKVPNGRWSLSVEDIYGDIIDHHLSYEGGSVGESMPDTTLISYYLSNPLKTSRAVLNMGKSAATAEAVSALEEAISVAAAAEMQFKNLGYGYNNTTIAPIDRKGLIDVRLELMAATDAFVETMK